MSLYDESLPQLTKMLRNLDTWLDQAAEAAEARGYDPELLVVARLYPDMFALARQIQSACDTAKFVASRLSGRDAPSHPDTEKTLPELRARIAETIAWIDGFDASAFEGAASRKLYLPFLQGGWVRGDEYLRSFALPNFYFHVTMAYAILRHNGVPLGKRTFIGGMEVQPPDGGASS